MTFLHPAILGAGLLAVAIPILIHFFMRRRRRPIPWAAMRFLMEAYRKRRRRLALEQLILLAARCLLIALLAGAIAHPLLGAARAGSGPPRVLVVLLDDSLTARVTDDSGATELSRSIELASRAVEQLDAARGDKAALITLGAPARAVIATPSADLAAVARAIESTQPTDGAADLAGAASLARAVLAGEPDAEAYVLVASGLHAGVAGTRADLAAIDRERDIRLTLPAPADGRANVAIASLTPARRVLTGDEPGGRLATAQLARSGPDLGTVQSSVQVADEATGRVLGSSAITFSPGERERTVSIPIVLDDDAPPGQRVLVATIADDALPADGVRRSIIESRRSVRVGIIARARDGAIGVQSFTPTDWLRAALAPADDEAGAFEVSVIDPARVDIARLARVDAAVVLEPNAVAPTGWRALRGFVGSGGLLMITPPATPSGSAWADAVRDELAMPWMVRSDSAETDTGIANAPEPGSALLGLIETELEYLAPPVRVTRSVEVTSTTPGERATGIELSLTDGSALLLSGTPEGARGAVVLLTAALDPAWTNLPTRPLFVPLVHEIVRQGVGTVRSGWESVAGAAAPAPGGAVELSPAFGVSRAGSLGVSGERTADAIRTTGAWVGVDEGGSPRGMVVVNAPEGASDTSAMTRGELEEWLGVLTPDAGVRWVERGDDSGDAERSLAQSMSDSAPGSPIAWIALVGALVLALVECVIGRRSSHAERIGAGA